MTVTEARFACQCNGRRRRTAARLRCSAQRPVARTLQVSELTLLRFCGAGPWRPETPRRLGVSAHPPRSRSLRPSTSLRCVLRRRLLDGMMVRDETNPTHPMRLAAVRIPPLAAGIALAVLAFVTLPAATSRMPVAEIEAGMQGVGVTVFDGTTREQFDVHVLGVLTNVLGPRRSLIVARLEGRPARTDRRHPGDERQPRLHRRPARRRRLVRARRVLARGDCRHHADRRNGCDRRHPRCRRPGGGPRRCRHPRRRSPALRWSTWSLALFARGSRSRGGRATFAAPVCRRSTRDASAPCCGPSRRRWS